MLIKHIVNQGMEHYVALVEDKFYLVEGDIFGKYTVTDKQLEGKEIPFCNPSKIVALGLNYYKHAEEFGSKAAVETLIFL
ncbi:MAG: hypothetical protein IJ032_00095, partial [Clostridia bacterium]|nr:hypothetical protein [Clostridia bacterium]